jgi:hypothetical protein
MTKKRTPAAERQRETESRWLAPSVGRSRITGRIPSLVPGLERALTWSGEPKDGGQEAPEPADKLDAAFWR